VGRSGSGKSTLLACLAGLDDPDAGTVTVAGQRISRIGEAARTRLRARTIGVLLQSSNLIEHLTVAANVTLAQSLAGHRGATANVMALLADAATACGAALVVATHDPAVAARPPLRWRLDDGVLHTCPAADR
jgi:putative ABC transport system ATP-binding protein